MWTPYDVTNVILVDEDTNSILGQVEPPGGQIWNRRHPIAKFVTIGQSQEKWQLFWTSFFLFLISTRFSSRWPCIHICVWCMCVNDRDVFLSGSLLAWCRVMIRTVEKEWVLIMPRLISNHMMKSWSIIERCKKNSLERICFEVDLSNPNDVKGKVNWEQNKPLSRSQFP